MEEEKQEVIELTVMEQPKLSDQVVAAAVGSVVTIGATVAITAAVEGVQKYILNRKAKKLAREDSENLDKE